MGAKELKIKGSWEISLEHFIDNRGSFFESFRLNSLENTIGRKFDIKQSNTSISRAGSIRGIHFAQVPPSQAKYIQCQKGSILDFVIDVRVGSPTFAQHVSIELNSKTPKAIFIEEGLAHAFIALEDDTIVTYFVNQYFNPSNEKAINPLDSEISINWGNLKYLISEKDKNAKTLSEMQKLGHLPIYEDCLKLIETLKN
jgi:dTDP-4-dehydrorhamnose 3,5-epimerase